MNIHDLFSKQTDQAGDRLWARRRRVAESAMSGYRYEPYEDIDDDTRKIIHMIRLPDGKQVRIPFTPYDRMTPRDVELWIQLGMPKGQGGSSLDSDTLERMAAEQNFTEGYAGVDDTDTVGFSVNSEAAYMAVMKRFGDVIDHDETSGIMYAPARVWPQIEMTAFDADPDDGATRADDDMMEGLRDPKDNPCWKGYKPVGTKQKGGRTVPNCVPKESVAEGSGNPLQDIGQNAWHLIQGDKPIAINFPDEARARSFHSGHGYGKETKVLHGSQVRRNAYLKHDPGVVDWPEYSKGMAEARAEIATKNPYRKGTLKHDIWQRQRQSYLQSYADDPHGKMKPGDHVGNAKVVKTKDGTNLKEASFRFIKYNNYNQWEDKRHDFGADYDETEIDGQLIGYAIRRGKVVGFWYNEAEYGTFVQNGAGFDDIMDYAENDTYWPDIYESLAEGSDDGSPVANAILQRIMMRHQDLLGQYGPVEVMAAADEIAELVGDVDEIGTSDVSSWVQQVIRHLDTQGIVENAPLVRYAIKHKTTKQVLSTHDDAESAKDAWRGLGSDRNQYRLVKTTKRARDFTLDETKKKDYCDACDSVITKRPHVCPGSEKLSEVSSPEEVDKADMMISKIVDQKENVDDYTPEEVAQLQKLSKITGRSHKLWNSRNYFRRPVGKIIDRIVMYAREKQRDSGQMPEFTGRATTAKDMATQIAVQTDGRYYHWRGTTWTSGRTGQRYRDASDFVSYKNQEAFEDAWAWVQSKGRQVHYRDSLNILQTAVQLGRYIVQRDTTSRGGETDYRLSVRSAKSLDQPSRKREDITDQQAAALRDIARTRNANAIEGLKMLVNLFKGEEDIKQIIDQSKKVDPRDKAKLDQIIASAGDFKEVSEGVLDRIKNVFTKNNSQQLAQQTAQQPSQTSPGAEPTRKQSLNLGTKQELENWHYDVEDKNDGSLATSEYLTNMLLATGVYNSSDHKRTARGMVKMYGMQNPINLLSRVAEYWGRPFKTEELKNAKAQLAMDINREKQKGKAIPWEQSQSQDQQAPVSEMDMSSPEFQQALARLKKRAEQGPLKTVYDPRTGRYRNVPVDGKKSDQSLSESIKHRLAEMRKAGYDL